MNFKCQEESIRQLNELADSDRHSVLIEGPAGCGKTYMSRMYSRMLKIDDFVSVDPNVQSVKDTLESCYDLDQNVFVNIENLDTGSAGTSYALLKFLEEPKKNVYIVVTCRNINKVPDTIISRSSVVPVSPPIDSDIVNYAKVKDSVRYDSSSKRRVWNVVRTFNDVDLVFKMSAEQLSFYDSLNPSTMFKDNISSLTWLLGHYPDNTETPLEFLIRYIMCNTNDRHLRIICADCVSDINSGRIAKHAVLAKFAFEGKYGE